MLRIPSSKGTDGSAMITPSISIEARRSQDSLDMRLLSRIPTVIVFGLGISGISPIFKGNMRELVEYADSAVCPSILSG